MEFWQTIKMGIAIFLFAVILIFFFSMIAQSFISGRIDNKLAAKGSDLEKTGPDIELTALLKPTESDEDEEFGEHEQQQQQQQEAIDMGYVSD